MTKAHKPAALCRRKTGKTLGVSDAATPPGLTPTVMRSVRIGALSWPGQDSA
ncbi:MAG: hypothetical protein ACPHUF_09820 [Gammaproteobacteria bacterium]